MKVESNETIKVLMFYDIKGWAWWYRIQNIAKNQSGDIKIDSLPFGVDFNHKKYDFILVFESFLVKRLSNVPREKLIAGCSCPKLMKEFLSNLLLFNPVAGLVNNQEMYNSSKDFYNIFCCPNGVDTDLFKPKENKVNNLTACWVGNTRSFADKGLNQIRHVCEKANINLIASDQSDNINGLLLPQIELRDKIYYKSDFYICFSDYEGTPNPALEALSCGLPVITTKVGNMPEIIINGINGFLTGRDETSLFNVIMELKKSNIQAMSINARNSILNSWSWKKQAKNYGNMFRSLKINYLRMKS